MTKQEIHDELAVLQSEYDALKKHLGEMLLEHNAQEESPDDVAYFTRKFEEARKRLRRSK